MKDYNRKNTILKKRLDIVKETSVPKWMLLEYADSTHNQDIQFNNIANRISYYLLQQLYNYSSKGIEVDQMSFGRNFIKTILTDDYITDENGNPDPILVEFMYALTKLDILFKTEIDKVSEYKKTKDGGYVIAFNYNYTKTVKTLKGFINQTLNHDRNKLFGINGTNTLPLKQMIRRWMNKEEINISDFDSFLRTNNQSTYQTFKTEIKRTLVHELRHMFDDIRTQGNFRQDDESIKYYANPDPNKKEYYRLRHEIDARIYQGINQTEDLMDSLSFEDYFKAFLTKGYRNYDFKKLTPAHKNYVRDKVEYYYDNHNVGHRSNGKYKLTETMINNNDEKKQIIEKCIGIICEDLGVDIPPYHLIEDKEYTRQHKSFAAYSPSTHEVFCVIEGRNTADCVRSIAHELMHHKQNLEGRLTETAGKDGDDFENEANSYSGKIMRRLGREIPNIFEDIDPISQVNETVEKSVSKRITKSEILQEQNKKNEKKYIQSILGRFL